MLFSFKVCFVNLVKVDVGPELDKDLLFLFVAWVEENEFFWDEEYGFFGLPPDEICKEEFVIFVSLFFGVCYLILFHIFVHFAENNRIFGN